MVKCSKDNKEYVSPFGVNNQLFFCGVPFRLDSYSGCEHRCRYCLFPDTLVTMANLTNKPIDKIQTGDKLIGFDEYPVNSHRHLRIATVLGTHRHTTENMWKIYTPDRNVLCTGDHPWLHARGGDWTRAERFRVQGTSLRKLVNPVQIEGTREYQYGYIAGLFDAEGSMRFAENQIDYYKPKVPYFVIGQAENNLEALYRLKNYLERLDFDRMAITEVKNNSQNKGQRFFVLQMQDLGRVRKIHELLKNRPISELEFRRGWLAGFFDGEGTCSRKSIGGSIFIAQKQKIYLDRLEEYGKSFNFNFAVNGDGGYLLGGTVEAIRFISLLNPAISRKKQGWVGNARWGTDIRIENTERLSGKYEVVDIETDTSTFIAAGFATHNCFARTNELTNNAVVSSRKGNSTILVPDKSQFLRLMSIALDWNTPRQDINIEWLRRRVPIHWGGMSDPFQPCELKYKITRSWMDRINWYQYPVAISTKGAVIATSPEYLKKLKEGKYVVQISLLGLDDTLIKQLEPGAPTATERLNALKVLADAGIWTAVRIQPVIPSSSLEGKLPEFVATLAKAGVKHVLTEGYKVQMRNSEWMREVWKLFPDSEAEYSAYSSDYFGFEKLLPSWRKYKYIKIVKQACHENGMTFGSADNDLRDLGDTICCCGLDNIPGFESFWRYQASQAVQVAKQKGYVSLDDMQSFWSGGKESMDSGNILNQEMYLDVYGYKKGQAAQYHQRQGAGLLGIQDGEMRKQARESGTRYTAKYCVDWMRDNGGDCSPEVIFSLARASDANGKVIYKYSDPIPRLESQQIKQAAMF